MTFVDLIIERHSEDRALQRAVALCRGRQYAKAVKILEALYCTGLNESARFIEIVRFYLIESRMALGKRAVHHRRFSEAIAHYRSAVRLAPHYADLHFTIGGIHLEQKQYHTARSEFLRALKINPQYQDARVQLGLLEFQQQKPAAAIRVFSDLAADCSLVNQEQFDRAMTASNRRQYRHAAALFAAAFTAKPDRSRALCAMGQDAYRERQYDKAIARFIGAEKLAPDHADIYNHLGACYSQKGQWGRATRQFELAVKLAPRFTRAWLNLAFTSERRGDADGALWAAKNVLRLDPGNQLAGEMVRRLTKQK